MAHRTVCADCGSLRRLRSTFPFLGRLSPLGRSLCVTRVPLAHGVRCYSAPPQPPHGRNAVLSRVAREKSRLRVRASLSSTTMTPTAVAACATAAPSSPGAGAALRPWDALPLWCALCREPVNRWDEHRGKREHICLEMVYDAVVVSERRWDPRDVWGELMDETSLRILRRGRSSAAAPGSGVASALLAAASAPLSRAPKGDCQGTCADAGMGAAAAAAAGAAELLLPPGAPFCPADLLGDSYRRAVSPVMALFESFEANDPQRRRRELLLLLRYLLAHDYLVLRPENMHHASFEGSEVMFKELFPALGNIFPLAEARQLSAMSQAVAASFNSETVFDLCRMELLLSPEIVASRNVAPPVLDDGEAAAPEWADGDIAASASASPAAGGGGASNSANAGGAAAVQRIPYYIKASFVRALLGALRWSLEPDNVCPPYALRHASGSAADATHIAVLAAHTARLLIAEALHCKLSEFVARVEPVFREEGAGLAEAAQHRFGGCSVSRRTPRRALAGATPPADYHRGKPEVVPPLPNWGMMRYAKADSSTFARGFIDWAAQQQQQSQQR